MHARTRLKCRVGAAFSLFHEVFSPLSATVEWTESAQSVLPPGETIAFRRVVLVLCWILNR